MNNQQSIQKVHPNPATYPRHRRQAFWQILFPIIIGAIILIALGVLASLGPNSQVARWGNISTIFVILPFLVILLVPLVIFGALAYALIRLLKVLPIYTHTAYIYVDHYGKIIQKIADKIARPVISVSSAVAGAQAVAKKK